MSSSSCKARYCWTLSRSKDIFHSKHVLYLQKIKSVFFFVKTSHFNCRFDGEREKKKRKMQKLNTKDMPVPYIHTLQKLEVYAWWNDLAKQFKICHIFGIKKTQIVFFPEMQNEKAKAGKKLFRFSYFKIWQILKRFARSFYQA